MQFWRERIVRPLIYVPKNRSYLRVTALNGTAIGNILAKMKARLTSTP